jgi:DNA-directed RNA polymerase specialized sigma24 family protein
MARPIRSVILFPVAKETEIGGGARDFPATRWTLILASRETPEARVRALRELLEAYWKPLYFYVRRKGLAVENAKDAVQGFCARLLEQDFLDRLDPAQGRFRGYLKTGIDNHLRNLHESRTARKRGGDSRTVALDFEVAERDLSLAPSEPDAAFDREWAVGVMERALAKLRAEFEAGERKGPFDVALKFFRPGEPPSYAEAAGESGMTQVQFKAFLHRARERFRRLVRDEVTQTLPDAAEVDAELAHLVKALGR